MSLARLESPRQRLKLAEFVGIAEYAISARFDLGPEAGDLGLDFGNKRLLAVYVQKNRPASIVDANHQRRIGPPQNNQAGLVIRLEIGGVDARLYGECHCGKFLSDHAGQFRQIIFGRGLRE